MIEFTVTEFVLLIIAAVGVSGTLHYRARTKHLGELLFGASLFVKKLVNDDKMRDELREMLKSDKDVSIKFGTGE